MPQLDKVHFFSQFFWLCVFYLGFYFLIVKHFLPKITRILQYRKSKLRQNPQENVGQELQLVQDSGKTAWENVYTASNKLGSHNLQRMQEWYRNGVSTLNHNYLKECNHLYIKKVGDYSLTQNAALGGITLLAPMATGVWLLTHKLKVPASGVKKGNISSKDSAPITFSTSSKPVNKKVTGAGQSHKGSLESTNPESGPQPTQPNPSTTHKKGKKGKK